MIEPREGDWIAVVGAPWIAPGMVRAIEIAKETHKVNVALLVHDLLPATSPQWFADAQGESAKRDIETLIRCADAVFAVSGEVVGELQQHYQKPTTLLMPADPELQSADQLQESDLRGEKERIILCVGTLHPRKNLVALVKIWERWCVQVLASGERIDTVPRLVLAGRRHPQDGELFRVLRESQHASTRIQLVHDADDRRLASLYRQSRFVVMPSLAEGWGLPIREALLAGRPSIATDAVPAATGSPFVSAVPAGDEVALEAAIKSWWTGSEPERLSKVIAENFQPRTWSEVADEFYQTLSASEVRR
jgi:glycosyltransferase involved in cell wall biosynthesis